MSTAWVKQRIGVVVLVLLARAGRPPCRRAAGP